MNYKLPLCAYSIHAHGLSQITDLYTDEQMQQAYTAGREAMREEAAELILKHWPNWSQVAKRIRSIK